MSKVFVKIGLAALFILTFFISSHSQKNDTSADLAQFNWLLGTWKNETSRGTSYEVWTRVSDRTFEGDSYTIKGGEKQHNEFLRIARFGSEIFYVSKVAHNKYPVGFKLIKVEDHTRVFENAEHDFPQRIIYKRKEDGSLHARIEGEKNGQERGVDFFFVKVE